jgi:hypothetical protein
MLSHVMRLPCMNEPPYVELQPPPTHAPSAAAPRQPSSQFHCNTSSRKGQPLLHRYPTPTCGCCARVLRVTAHAASSQMRLPRRTRRVTHSRARAAVALCNAPAGFWAESSSCAAPRQGPRVQAHQQGRACSKCGYARSSRAASHARATAGHAQGVTPCSASSRPRRICCSGSTATATRW